MRKLSLTRSQKVSQQVNNSEISLFTSQTSTFFQTKENTLSSNSKNKAGLYDPLPECSVNSFSQLKKK